MWWIIGGVVLILIVGVMILRPVWEEMRSEAELESDMLDTFWSDKLDNEED